MHTSVLPEVVGHPDTFCLLTEMYQHSCNQLRNCREEHKAKILKILVNYIHCIKLKVT